MISPTQDFRDAFDKFDTQTAPGIGAESDPVVAKAQPKPDSFKPPMWARHDGVLDVLKRSLNRYPSERGFERSRVGQLDAVGVLHPEHSEQRSPSSIYSVRKKLHRSSLPVNAAYSS